MRCAVAAMSGMSLCLVVTGCGFAVQSADLFSLTRSGQGRTSTILVNDGGTIRCDGGAPRPLPGPQLLSARDLATSLDNDVKSRLKIPPATPASVYRYRVTLQDGTLAFSDTAAAAHTELAQAALFATQAFDGPCAGS